LGAAGGAFGAAGGALGAAGDALGAAGGALGAAGGATGAFGWTGGAVGTAGGGDVAVPEMWMSAQFQNSSGYAVPHTGNVGSHQMHGAT
jgi:hypothetical protein